MNFKLKVLILLLFLEFTKCTSTAKSATTKLNKISLNKISTTYANKTLNVTRSKKTSSTISTNTGLVSNKKWKIGRVTNKQYGIINILWQKTKVFIDQDYSNLTCKATTIEITPEIKNHLTSQKETSKLSTAQVKVQTSTPSYIEFYYLDQADDRIKRKNPSNTKLQRLKKGNKTNVDRSNNKKSPSPSLYKIHVNTLQRNQPARQTKSAHNVGQSHFYRNKLNKSRRTTFVSKAPSKVTTKAKIRKSKQPNKIRSQQTIKTYSKSTALNIKTKKNEKLNRGNNNSYTTKFGIGTTYVGRSVMIPASTSTDYDKVKFFELYDNNTPKLNNYFNSNLSNMIYDNNNSEKTTLDDNQILLHHVHENIGHHQNTNKTRYVKKHIQDLYSKEGKSQNGMNISKYISRHDLEFSLDTTKFQVSVQKNSSWGRPTVWSEFPFVAVYIYEPLQVHCDAASISAHWLLAAASCLSRHRKGLRGGGLSAFVTFCGDNWRYPQMISYVKRTLIHPLYHPKDKLRCLFNAGLIQIVNSMADTCSGWAPVSLMSHQYTADEKGSIGTAVGWGLDRYDESYTATNIPKHPLMVYEGRVYSQSCPGSSEYSQAMSSDEVDVRNVYCLLLPPYLAEENDTVHGALLLIGGKLLALYLKEERRPWGMQSAQYASIWRLLPWITETAREPDDSFQIEI